MTAFAVFPPPWFRILVLVLGRSLRFGTGLALIHKGGFPSHGSWSDNAETSSTTGPHASQPCWQCRGRRSKLFSYRLVLYCWSTVSSKLIPVWLSKISQARVAVYALDQRSCSALAMVLIQRIIEQHYLLCLQVIFAFRILSSVSYLGECSLIYNSGYSGEDFKRLNLRFHYLTFGHFGRSLHNYGETAMQ